jgi:hypothetical protein
MVADQDYPSILTRESRHAVVCRRHLETIVHRVARFRDDAIAESVRQIQQLIGIRAERADAVLAGIRRPRDGRTGCRRSEALQEPASIDHRLDRAGAGRAG